MIKASLLTIGDEVVDGQILNRNASWLSQALVSIDFEMKYHLSVKDEAIEIHRALDFLAPQNDLIITTGGLGPTSDDCTRSSIAHWLDRPLQQNPEYWARIQRILRQRQVLIREEHSNQSLAPEGAFFLENNVGVAPGFIVTKDKRVTVASLPGPPRELQAIWNDNLKRKLIESFDLSSESQLKTFICFNLPESDLQHRVKNLLSKSGYKYGFRLHKPYVELKVWVPKHQDSSHKLVEDLKDKLQGFYKGETIAECRRPFVESFQKEPMAFLDLVSKGRFHGILSEVVSSKINYSCYDKDLIADLPRLLEAFYETCRNLNQKSVVFLPKEDQQGIVQIGRASTALESAREALTEISIHTPRSILLNSILGNLFFLEKFFHAFERY